ncbi:MAG: hypothetical protein ABJC79_04340 [Acidimicrobiia bacterium]
MQFTQDSHAAIADGSITVSFRLWTRPQAKVGGRYAVGAVVIEVDAIEMIPFHAVTDADVRNAGATDREALRKRAAHAGPIEDDTLLYRLDFHVAGERTAPDTVPLDGAAVAQVIEKLDRMDARSKRGPWTQRVLEIIGDQPATVSTELAEQLDRARFEFKTDVRKLKALNLTESLLVGYQLTPLGRLVVTARRLA